jgi:hypothetical protein
MQARINERDLRGYFANEALAVETATDVPMPLSGEVLVAQQMLTRHQLLVALQLQDSYPDQTLGACVACLGYARAEVLEPLLEHRRTARLADVLAELESES